MRSRSTENSQAHHDVLSSVDERGRGRRPLSSIMVGMNSVSITATMGTNNGNIDELFKEPTSQAKHREIRIGNSTSEAVLGISFSSSRGGTRAMAAL